MVRKMTNEIVTVGMLRSRAESNRINGYAKPKYIKFCEQLLKHGYSLELYEARSTFSKYITVRREGDKTYKVRFSNHKPNLLKEKRGDCDYFVGVTNLKVTNWIMATKAVHKFFDYVPNHIEEITTTDLQQEV